MIYCLGGKQREKKKAQGLKSEEFPSRSWKDRSTWGYEKTHNSGKKCIYLFNEQWDKRETRM